MSRKRGRPEVPDDEKRIRISLTISPDGLSRIDDFCRRNSLNRSGFFELVAMQYIDAVEARPSIQRVLDAMSAVVDGVFSGNMPPEQAQSYLNDVQSSYDELRRRDIGCLPVRP